VEYIREGLNKINRRCRVQSGNTSGGVTEKLLSKIILFKK
jgi:hypothetical protein